MSENKAGDVVVILVRGKPRIALYVAAMPVGTSHAVRDGERDRLVRAEELIALTRQP